MTIYLTGYAATLVCFLVLDGLWLGLIARKFYQTQLGDRMLPSPRFGIATVFYLFFAAAIAILAVFPATSAQSLAQALLRGGVLGLAAYGTYDMTNLATLKNWPVKMSIVDLAWGTIVTAAAAGAGYSAASFVA